MPERPASLSSDQLAHEHGDVPMPRYDRSALQRSIVHIGVGGFHRAHLAVYIDELCRQGRTDWSIVGAGVMPGDIAMADALRPQDHLYTLIVRGADDTDVRVIGSIVDYLLAAPDADELVAAIAHSDTQIVSLTITEGGYPVDDATGEYRADSAVAGPGSVFAIIAAGLDRRRLDHGKPLTLLSCDNVLSNGDAARASMLGEATAFGGDLTAWVEQNVAFPNSMVDRITPATTDTDRDWLAEHHGIADHWPVVTEPFCQWVVEDRFAGDRLPLEMLDVIVTDDVEPYEMMKLRLLNAGHSCLAYLASLSGFDTVDEAMADPRLRSFVGSFLQREARPMLPAVEGIDLDDYVESLIVRFSNPNIGDQIARLCLDGTAKFPKFLLPTIRKQLDADGSIDLAALALAGWCQYLVAGSDESSTVELSPDPALDEAVEYARASVDTPTAFLDFERVFDRSFRDARFAAAFATALEAIRSGGVRSAIDNALAVGSP